MKIDVKTKIRYKGQEYSNPNDLPPEVHMAYEKAMANGRLRTKIAINGEEFATENEMPDGVRKLYEDAMSVVENNGEVTLPRPDQPKLLLTRPELLLVVLLTLGLISLIIAKMAS